ncbi:MAG: tetratricopeptide (TPR) repeat protein [Cellvibrionaceae bacterium]|jgi:tetratricopeptide (TPR) repeat protein
MLLLIILTAGGLITLFSNIEQVVQVIIPTITPEPTRSAESFAFSAALYNRDGDTEKSIEAYRKAIVLDSNNPNYYIDLINLLTIEGDAEEALEVAEQVSIIAPDDADVLVAVASAYLQNGERLAEIGERDLALSQYERAIQSAERAIGKNPDLAVAYALQAGALIQQDRDNYQRSNELIELAIALDTKNEVVHYYRGIVFETQGYYDRAIESYEAARQINPAYLDASLAVAYSYFYTDNRQRAIVTLRDQIEATPNNASLYDALGWMYFLAGQYAESEATLEKAVNLDASLVRAQAHLGAAYFKNSNYDFAIPRLESAVDSYEQGRREDIPLTESTSIYYNYLAFAYYRTNEDFCFAPMSDDSYTAEGLFNIVIEEMGPEGIRGENAKVGLEDCRKARIDAGG